ncbi:MAG: hypothetical protein ACRD03_05450, partial [Acidimicrobiales bacterium]
AGFCGRCGAPAGAGLADELERLGRLHGAGELDDTEFAAAKAAVLARSRPAGPFPAQAVVGQPAAPVWAAGGFAVAAAGLFGALVFEWYRFDDGFAQTSDDIWSAARIGSMAVVALFALGALAVRRWPLVAAAVAVPALCYGALIPAAIRTHDAEAALGWWMWMAAVSGAALAALAAARRLRPPSGWAERRALPMVLAAVTSAAGFALWVVDRYRLVDDDTVGGRLHDLLGGEGPLAVTTATFVLAVLVAGPALACAVGGARGAGLAVGVGLVPLSLGEIDRLVLVAQGDAQLLTSVLILPAAVAAACALAVALYRAGPAGAPARAMPGAGGATIRSA